MGVGLRSGRERAELGRTSGCDEWNGNGLQGRTEVEAKEKETEGGDGMEWCWEKRAEEGWEK